MTEKRAYGQPLDFILIDTDDNLKPVLKMYDSMYWIFNETAKFPSQEFSLSMKAKRFLQLPFPENNERITRDKILETGCIEWCVAHAFSGSSDYIGKIQATNNNNILVSALLMSVTAPLYISPPSFDEEVFAIIFSAVLGLATFIQLFNLVAFTAVSDLINQAYEPSLTMHARVEAEFYTAFLSYLVYTGVALFMAGLLFVAYVGSVVDLYIMLLVIPLIGLFIYILISTSRIAKDLRRESVYQFYELYCEPDGKLLPQYLNLAYSDFEKQIKIHYNLNDEDHDDGDHDDIDHVDGVSTVPASSEHGQDATNNPIVDDKN